MACARECNDCLNGSIFEPCGDNLSCCTYCPDGAPCAYAVLFQCAYEKDYLFTQPITLLWKECLFDCKWTARRCLAGYAQDSACYDTAGSGGPPFIYSMNWASFLGCGEQPTEFDIVTTPESDAFTPGGTAKSETCGDDLTQYFPPVCDGSSGLEHTRLKFECDPMVTSLLPGYDQSVYRCGWHDWYGVDYPCEKGPTWWEDALATCTAVVWQLEVTSATTATLTGYADPNGGNAPVAVVVYECEEWQCLERSTFTMTGYPAESESYGYYLGLPRKVCVAPYSSDWNSFCDTKAAACACYDAGWNNICLDISGVVCGSLQNEPEPVNLIRYRNGDGMPFAGISTPSPAPCGYFTASSNSDCDGTGAAYKLGWLIWCDGSDYQLRVYCRNVGAGTTTEICSTTCTITDTCPDGVRFTFDCGTISSACCPSCDTTIDICGCDIPTTLFATLDMPTCATIDGQVVTLEWNGDSTTLPTWIGTFNAGTCGNLTFNAYYDPALCYFTTWTIHKTGTPADSCVPNSSLSPTTCWPGTLTGNGTWNNPPCSCCTHGDATSVTITP